MRSLLAATLLVRSLLALANTPLDANLAYNSPFHDYREFSHDINKIDQRHTTNQRRILSKRQLQDANVFNDMHYATFYGADFSNSPFVWSGGINFTHSVASGDPLDSSVLLWTRAVPSPLALSSTASLDVIPDQSVPVCVSYSVFDNPDLSGKEITSGEAFTSYDVDFTVKVEATGLNPDTLYWFFFNDCTDPSNKSPIGSTRTFASPDTPADKVNNGKPLTFAVFSCSQFQSGWFNAYGFATFNTSADVFIHLGDYIYEDLGNGAPIGRPVLGRELATVADYRLRLNQYRTDQSLVAAHQTRPWIADDHEVADNSWKAGTADSNDTALGCSFSPSGACFTDRKLAAVRAYHEWMPVRQVSADDKLRIWRNFQVGKLLDLTMLDTRQYDRDLTDVYYNTEYVNTISAFENRSLMGFPQENWFHTTLSESKDRGAIWRIVGQQIVFTQLNISGSFDLDAWDGYRANRARVLKHISSNKIDNVIILSGDSHANWASDLAFPNDTKTYNSATGNGALGVEFAGTAVSSGSSFGSGISPERADVLSTQYVSAPGNEDLQWSEGSYRGFFTLTIDPSTIKATYYAMRNLSFANLDGFASANFTVNKGANKLARPVAGGSVLAGVLKSSVLNTTSGA
ncbi:alkaline phosphatase [Pyrrhoderma noxium]|uniref:Alkaline phosphatase n=1 Tax=Pyrrhoderma noxium TaxID=2282107 RepID=A0A286UIU4_9AGAM|nr:alkaline phosphatase [Pyrrhoderma noxium]